MNRAIGLATLLGACAALVGCNTVPVSNLEKTFSIHVTQESGTAEKVKIDFLWMVDNSTSMCEEQVALARNFQTFVDTLGQLDIDPRIAVTTADMQCDPDMEGVTTSMGKFNTEYEDSFPPACFAQKKLPCVVDADCDAATGEPGKWKCDPAQSLRCVVTPNGSVNSSCVRTCVDDEECQQYFDDINYVCQAPSGLKGCVLPPQTQGCPAELPPILDDDTKHLFPCLATVGVNQHGCFDYEQGLQAALSAIDPSEDNPNSEQAKSFLREDAYLVIIFVTDEDDCSVPPGKPANWISEGFYDTCAVLLDDTTVEGGKLVPVSHYINRFKSLKSDPARVIVAAIAGEGLSEPPPFVGSPPVKSCRNDARDACRLVLPEACLNMAPECVDLNPPECQSLPVDEQEECVLEAKIDCVEEDTTSSAYSCLDDAVDACEDQYGLECVQQMAREFFCEDPDAPSCDPSSVVDEDALLEWERQMFLLAKGDSVTCYNQSYVCESDVGTADWGRRYKQLTDGFGHFGLFRNICSAEGIGPALEQIAQLIVSVVNKICMPQQIKDEADLVVYKQWLDPATNQLTGEYLLPGAFEEGGDYRLIDGGEDCIGPDGSSTRAITFNDPPQLNEQIILSFEGDPIFEL